MNPRAVPFDLKSLVFGRQAGRARMLPYLFLIPSLALIILIQFYPFATGVSYSLREGSLLKLEDFVGLQNYQKLPGIADFWRALGFSGLFALTNVVGSYLLGLGLALLLNLDIPGRKFFRIALLIPWILPSIVSVISWRWMIADQYGLVNMGLKLVGMNPIYFLSTENWASVSVIVVKIWRSYPFMMISCLAALQAIDRELYEAASIDGAGRWQLFRFITFPHIKNVSIVLWILMTIYSINDFDTIWLLTMGGPSYATENLIILAYRYTFGANKVGMGSTIAVITLLILLVLGTFMLNRQSKTAFDQE
ncbi:MAG: sugar ABC transporter permease [Anaerolineae bacterium]|nr:sugar ABC transporter permease [Anaerolineae bacterium]